MFKPIKTEDYQTLKPYFDIHGWGLCEYALASILAWNRCLYNVHYREEGDLLFISEVEIERPDKKRLLLPLSKPFRCPLPAELAGWAAKFGYSQYYYATEDYIKAAGLAELEKFFTIKEQPGYMDYIYKTSDMARLAGHKYSKKRNLIAQFNKLVKGAASVKVESISARNAAGCLEMLEQWARDPEQGAQLDMLNCERKAIVNGLKNFQTLEMLGITVLVEDKISGFAFGAPLSADTFVLNFEKALGSIKGLYQFLDNELAKSLPARYEYINKESDLEKPGLAKAKESYYPCRKVRSYTLTLK